MPNKSKSSVTKSQAQLKRSREAKTRATQYQKQLMKNRAAAKRSEETQLRHLLKNVRGKGIYDPKGNELTKYRKSRLRKAVKEFGSYLDPTKYFFVPAPKNRKKEVIERATNLKIKTSSIGVFIEKAGHKKATLKEDKKRREIYIERSGKTKRGATKGKRYRTITPLASLDELDNERVRIKALADGLGKLKKNEVLAFKIQENGGEGYSHLTFGNIDLLLNYLDKYKKSAPAKINFYRHIQVEKVETSDKWFKEHPVQAAGRPGQKARAALRNGKRK